eukprot:scaffold39112_cov153-Skeletonema_marinoi.AAC.5
MMKIISLEILKFNLDPNNYGQDASGSSNMSSLYPHHSTQPLPMVPSTQHSASYEWVAATRRLPSKRFWRLFFEQLCGTAMGTSVAVIYASLYYGWHEKIIKLLPIYNKFILDLSRFVDDMCVLRLGSYIDFLNFKRDIDDYGIQYSVLRWTMEEPSNTAIFLDSYIAISNDGVISTKLITSQ